MVTAAVISMLVPAPECFLQKRKDDAYCAILSDRKHIPLHTISYIADRLLVGHILGRGDITWPHYIALTVLNLCNRQRYGLGAILGRMCCQIVLPAANHAVVIRGFKRLRQCLG